jgi:cobalt/nickel transport system permease protein
MLDKIGEIYSLEQLAAGKTILHRLHPGVKIFATVFFLVAVLSLDRYSFGRLLPFLFYPCITLALAGIPLGMMFRRTALALPFCLFAGLSNLVLERGIAFTVAALPVTYGFLSLCTLLLRTALCVLSVLILAALTPFTHLSGQLRRFGAPPLFIALLEILYRYIPVLLLEAASMTLAYTLRSNSGGSIKMAHIGSFAGSLFLRSAGRADRVYTAMKCRLYSLDFPPGYKRPLAPRDIFFLALVCGSCTLFRLADIPLLLGTVLGRALSL